MTTFDARIAARARGQMMLITLDDVRDLGGRPHHVHAAATRAPTSTAAGSS